MFSADEKLVLTIIGKRHVTISTITKKFYDTEYPELDWNNYIAGVIRRINRKSKENKLTWFINGEGSGRGGKTVWKDMR